MLRSGLGVKNRRKKINRKCKVNEELGKKINMKVSENIKRFFEKRANM